VHSKANRFAVLPEQSVQDYVDTGDRAMVTSEGRLKAPRSRDADRETSAASRSTLAPWTASSAACPGSMRPRWSPSKIRLRGHRVVAYVETSSHTKERLLELCREKLSAREVPSEIRVMARLPRNARGKLDRAALAGEAR